MRFKDQVAIITGAAMGIGRAIARQMAEQGAEVVIADINGEGAAAVADEINAAGHKARFYEVDITDPAAVKAMVDDLVGKVGRIDVLVNNAGVVEDEHPVQEMSDEQWHRVIAVNLHAVFYCSRAVLPTMLEAKNGRIVMVTSIAGKEGVPCITDYAAAKAGAINFTKCLAKEVARSGITVNCVTPGLTDGTDMAAGFTPEQKAIKVGKVPMARMAQPDEVAAVAVFLASPEASFVTGAVYDVTGGRSDY